jgi:hypothetical protein
MKQKLLGILAWMVQKFFDFFVVIFMPGAAVICVLWILGVL